MFDEASRRSNLIDVTYQQLHESFHSQQDGIRPSQYLGLLTPRLEQLKNLTHPFGRPSDASRRKIESNSVTLEDGVQFAVEDADREVIFAISRKFDIDEVQAFILLRSFFYNRGVPPEAGTGSVPFVDSVLQAITPFYYSEYSSALRIIIPLVRAYEHSQDPAYEASMAILPQILQDPPEFIRKLLRDYVDSTRAKPDEKVVTDYKSAVRWAKENARTQIALLEILFWLLMEYYLPCEGWLVVLVLEAAHSTNMGTLQENSALMMDADGRQLLEDIEALWTLISIEVFDLERIAEPGELIISADHQNKKDYTTSPKDLKRIHEIVTCDTGGQYACTFMAWAYVLSRLAEAAKSVKEVPEDYKELFTTLYTSSRSWGKDGQPVHIVILHACLEPQAGLFKRILWLLTESPLFVASVGLKVNSCLTDYNEIAFRSVLKGLVMVILESTPVEFIHELDTFVEIWIALFGRSESTAVDGICRQFWNSDRIKSISRSALLDVARAQFPVRPRMLLRILRSLTAFGYMDTDPLSNDTRIDEDLTLDRDYCAQEVFQYFRRLHTYTQVIPSSAISGAHALYDKLPERNSVSVGVAYTNHRPIKLPGGSILPPKSVGCLLSPEGGENIVVAWSHVHSGWKLVIEIMTTYVYRRRLHPGLGSNYKDVNFGRRGTAQPVTLCLDNIGMELDSADDEALITDCLDLISSVVQDNPNVAGELLRSLETGNAVVAHTMTEAEPPDLVQLTTLILEEALSRAGQHSKKPPRREIIISSMNVLAALLPLSNYSNRVWLFLRSTPSLFGNLAATGGLSNILAAEKITGRYTMTLALLNLVQQLLREGSCRLLSVLPSNARLQEIKEEVLQRIAQFVHEKIWREYVGWRYARMGDKSEIGRRIAAFYIDVLEQSPPSLKDAPFSSLSEDVVKLLLFEANVSTINPIITSVTEGGFTLNQLLAARRYSDSRRLILVLELHLRLARMVLNHKLQVTGTPGLCLLERVLCGKGPGGASTDRSERHKYAPMDMLLAYVKDRNLGRFVPYEAARVLFALCASLASSQLSPPTIVGHLSDPEGAAWALVRIVQNPYDELYLRMAVWNFMSLAVDREPALATLFVAGSFRTPERKDGAADTQESNDAMVIRSRKRHPALTAASDVLSRWKELWEHVPQLLFCVLQFLDMVWFHAIEHRTSLQWLREDIMYWENLVAIIMEELGPVPDYKSEKFVDFEEARHSNLHEAVSSHVYRTMSKALALQIVARDIELRSQVGGNSHDKLHSYKAIESVLTNEDQLTDFVFEAATSSYDPSLYDEFVESAKEHCSALDLEQLRVQDPEMEREFGDGYAFSMSLLQLRLHAFRSTADMDKQALANELEHTVYSMNLNLSIAHSQSALSCSWQHLLRGAAPFLRTIRPIRVTLLTLAASISENVAREKRSGEMMSAIHNGRLGLILALLEAAWFSDDDKREEIEQFVAIAKNVHDIILNKPQAPQRSFMSLIEVPFHRALLQIIYFCLRQARTLITRPKTLNAAQRLVILSTLEAAQVLDIDALRTVLDLAKSRTEADVDQDLQLLIAVFEQCTHPDLSATSTFWLTRCQEANVVRASLELFSQMDIVGVSDVPALRTRRRALYTDRILQLHLVLACVPLAAERLATEGLLVAYSNNRISEAVNRGLIDVIIPELPGERSPAHQAYCMMLSIVACVFEALGKRNHHFDLEACAFVQVSGQQIARTLSWTIGDPLSLSLIEEMEQTINLFYAIAESTSAGSKRNERVQRVLRAFTSTALLLLQQLNYALTHPNHLASILEAVTADERQQLERDARGPSVQSTEHLNPRTRPFLTGVAHKLFRLTGSLLSTLISISGAETVLVGNQDDWPSDEAVLFPHSKVVLDERASLGTLLELGNCTLDVLRTLSTHTPGQTIVSSSSSSSSLTYRKPLDVKDVSDTARRNLEAVLFYGVTQLAMWSAKHEFEGTEMDVEESPADLSQKDELKRSSGLGASRRERKSTSGLGGNLKRGMIGEVVGELQALMGKARNVLGRGEGIDLLPLLERFLNDRVLGGS